MERVGIGIIGSRFVADLHADALRRVRAADLIACASPNATHVAELAERYAIPHQYTDYREMLARDDVQLVTLALPNDRHVEACVAAAQAGKHVIVEKPLCL